MSSQPKAGDLVVLCPHIDGPGKHHVFELPAHRYWLAACQACFDRVARSGRPPLDVLEISAEAVIVWCEGPLAASATGPVT
jgi:hypothetical protein